MLPVVRGEGATRQQILVYAALTVALTVVPVVGGTLGAVYGIAAGVLGGLLLGLAVRMVRAGDGATDRRFYLFTLVYLAALFLAMLVDHAVGG
jgi:protoheme IX farnesyltransferase